MAFSSSLLLQSFFYLLLLQFFASTGHENLLKGINTENPIIDITPSPLTVHSATGGSKDVIFCERVQVSGLSRLKLGSYSSSFRVTLVPSVVIPDRLHSKIQVCFHWNVSLGLCQCENGEWRTVQKGFWSSIMSPYDKRFIDVKYVGDVSGTVTVTVEEDFQQWRLLCLAFGFVLLLLAPIISSWVPFYYSSSMAIGVLLVIIILLFQGMKLLPTGRKNVFYLTIYGSLIGVGSFILHQFSMLVNSILVNFGLGNEMHNPVSVFLLVGVVLAGAALGYWIVRKFVISEDGSVDVGIAQFVKWAMRVIAATFIFQSTLDTPLAIGAFATCWLTCFLIASFKWSGPVFESYPDEWQPWWWWSSKRATPKQNRAEFLSKKKKMSPQGALWGSPVNSPRSPISGSLSPLESRNPQSYYSTFHKTPKRKHFSKREWEEFTQDSTRRALTEWASSPEFADWIMENADRIRLRPDDSSDESVASGPDSTDEAAVGSINRGRLFKWY